MSDDINRVPIRVVKHIHAPNHSVVAATLAPNSGAVPVTSKPGRERPPEPTLGSGSGVRGWGRSRPGCSPTPFIRAAKTAAPSARKEARWLSAKQTRCKRNRRSTTQRSLASDVSDRGELASMLEG